MPYRAELLRLQPEELQLAAKLRRPFAMQYR